MTAQSMQYACDLSMFNNNTI